MAAPAGFPAGKRPTDAPNAAPAKRIRSDDPAPWTLECPPEVYNNVCDEAKQLLKQCWNMIKSRNKSMWNEFAWLGSAMPYSKVVQKIGQDKAKKLNWVGLWEPEAVGKYKKGKREKDSNGQFVPGPAAFFFTKARLVDEEEDPQTKVTTEIITEVGLGDSVELNTCPAYHLRVEMFIADVHGEMFLLGRWFYKALETFIAVKQFKAQQQEDEEMKEADGGEGSGAANGPKKAKSKGASKNKKKEFEKQLPVDAAYLDDRRVWIASDKDDKEWNNLHLVNSISRKVIVKHVYPGDPAPASGTCDFWFDQSHDRMFCTFEDFYPEGTDKHRERQEAQTEEKVKEQGKKVQLNVLELFSGAGGLSFLAQSNDSVDIKCKWAVDVWDDACATYWANNPETCVYRFGIDEFLMLCKLFLKLSKKYHPDWKGKDRTAARTRKIKSIQEINIKVDADDKREKRNNSSKGHLIADLTEEQCHLVFFCKEQVGNTERDVRLTEKDLEGYENMLFQFVDYVRKNQLIPLPGDVHLVAGGPPCQNISGLNRHAKRQDVLSDPKNRLVKTYYQVINFFKPDFTLMEQVQGIITKESGMYIKFIVAMMLHDRYQVRIGVIAAGDFGCAQGRFRVFTWGAASGKTQLPPFPEPTHRLVNFHQAIGSEGQECRIGFLSEESRKAALDMVLLGDVLSDLPEVDNYYMSDYNTYKSDPVRPFQLYIRRPPPPGEESLVGRFHNADVRKRKDPERPFQIYIRRDPPKDEASLVRRCYFTEDTKKYPDLGDGRRKHINMVLDTFENGSAISLGSKYLCKEPEVPGSYYRTTWDAELKQTPAAEHSVKWARWLSSRLGYAGKLGIQIHGQAKKADELEKEVLAMVKSMREVKLKERKGLTAAEPEFRLTLRDHRPLICNSDDYLRITHVPKRSNAAFFDWPGVVRNENGSYCGGAYHAPRRPLAKNPKPGCAGGGVKDATTKSIHKSTRVDHADKNGWRGTHLAGCPSFTVWLPTGASLCPRWCLTYKDGKQNNSGSRHVCYGRTNLESFPPTVVGRAEPHNMRILHPTQDRVMTIRENARCQGFPDYYVFVAMYKDNDYRGGGSIKSRYQQIGNAVAPPVSAALGRCLAEAASWKVPHEQPVIRVEHPELKAAMEESERLGLKPYFQDHQWQKVPDLKCSILSDNKPKVWGEEIAMPAEEQAEWAYEDEDEDYGFGAEQE